MARSRYLVLVAITVVLAAGVSAVAGATAAVADAPASWVSLYGSPGGRMFNGDHELFVPSATTQVSVTGTPAGITVNASTGSTAAATLMFAPVQGGQLSDGFYPDAQESATATDPAQTVGIPGPCYLIRAEFQILDIAFANGSVSRLDLAFDQRCETTGLAPVWVLGEVAFNEAPSSAISVESSALLFPAQYVGVPNFAVPLTVANNSVVPVAIGKVSASGTGASDVEVTADPCPAVLDPGATCTVLVTVTPGGSGLRQSVISIPAGSSTATVQVSDTGTPGNAAFVLDSVPGEWVGNGHQLDDNQFNSFITVAGDDTGIGISDFDGFNDFDASIIPPAGQTLAVGTYQAQRTRYEATGFAGLDISGDSRGCNTIAGQVTIHEIAFDQDGRIQRLAADAVQYCDGEPPLFATFRIASSFGYSAIGLHPDPGAGPVGFATEVPGNTSPAQTVTVTNTGVLPLSVAPSLAGADPADFAMASSSCVSDAPLVPGASCSVSVTFSPQAIGTRTASLVLTDSTPRGQHVVEMTGLGVTAPTFTSPLNNQVITVTQSVTWVTSPVAQGNYLVVGTTPGSANIVNSGVLPGSQLSYSLPSTLPIGVVYATVFTKLAGNWSASQSISFYIEPLVASFTYPTPGLISVDATKPITWAANSADQGFYLVVGTSPGGTNLINSGILPATQTSYKPPPMPAEVLYATLFTKLNGGWNFYQSMTLNVRSSTGTFTSPLNGQHVSATSTPFTWTTVSSVQGFYLVVGTTPGSANLLNSGVLPGAPQYFPAVHLPTGAPLYATLFTKVGGSWNHSQAITFTAN